MKSQLCRPLTHLALSQKRAREHLETNLYQNQEKRRIRPFMDFFVRRESEKDVFAHLWIVLCAGSLSARGRLQLDKTRGCVSSSTHPAGPGPYILQLTL